jgi:RNA polymerase sigma factor (TIGR02999 family)
MRKSGDSSLAAIAPEAGKLAVEPAVPRDVTSLLQDARAGDDQARARLIEAVYDELHRMAQGLMRHERPGHTLQPTALVNEAVIRLLDENGLARVDNRRYLFGAAAQAMRQVLVDHARRRNAAKRAGAWERVPLDDALAFLEGQHIDVIALHEAIDRLTEMHERQGLVVVLRFFAGLSIAEVAQELGLSPSTVEADWRLARAWLRGQLGEGSS